MGEPNVTDVSGINVAPVQASAPVQQNANFSEDVDLSNMHQNGGQFETDANKTSKKPPPRGDNGPKPREVCRDFTKNICNRGSRCKFLHPPSDLMSRDMPPPQQRAPPRPRREYSNASFSDDVDGANFDNGRLVKHEAANDGGMYNSERGDVCRDFLKNICNRGTRCKFYHPPEMVAVAHETREDVQFCLDFQNKGCNRDSCRYVHAYREDADAYRRHGEVSTSLARAIAAVTHKRDINGIPFCKEFSTGSCSRGNRCRYWHINPKEERELREGGHAPRRNEPTQGGFDPYRDMPLPRGGGYDYDYGPPPMKRGRYDRVDTHLVDIERRNAELQQENEALKRELKRERERYEDLYYLFRRDAVPPGAPPQAPAPVHQGPAAPQPPMGMNVGDIPTPMGGTPMAGELSYANWTQGAMRGSY